MKLVAFLLLMLLKRSVARDIVQRTDNTDRKLLPGVKRDTSPYLWNQNYHSNTYPSCCSDPASACCVSSSPATLNTIPPTCCESLPGYVHEVKVTPTDKSCCTGEIPTCCNLSTPPSCCHTLALKLNESKAVPARLPSDLTLHIKVVPGNATTTPSPPTTGHGSTIATAGTISQNNFSQQALSEHNNRRSIHGAPPLQLSENLSKAAQAFANKLAVEKKAFHSRQDERPSVGENIAEKCTKGGTPLNGVQATDMWYREVKNYDFNNPGYKQTTSHFTQVVWKGTKSAGFGRAQYQKGGQTCYVAVGRYLPRGNVKGQFPQNVLLGSHDQTLY